MSKCLIVVQTFYQSNRLNLAILSMQQKVFFITGFLLFCLSFMTDLSGRFKRFLNAYPAQVGIILLLFVISQFLSSAVFYNGFLSNFNYFNKLIFDADKIPAFLSFVPYHSGSLLIASFLHPFFILTLLLFYLPLFLKRKIIRAKLFIYGGPQRLIVFTSAFLLVWELTTYNYNYYLDHAFYLDRVILLVLALLLLRSPLFLPLFIAWAYVYRSQFNYPIDGFALFDKKLLFDLLVMFMAYMYAKIYYPFLKISFVFLSFCIIAADYFICAAAKIVISPNGYEWLVDNDPVDLFMNVHARGWLTQSSETTINSFSTFLAAYGKLFQAVVFILEFLALFLLRSRKWSIALLCCLCSLHIGIFIFGSMLFWKWMVIDLVLIFILFRYKKLVQEELFSKKLFVSSLIIILCSFLWLKPVPIAWFDTPANQYFTYEVVTDEGKTFEFDKNQMNPYHQWFQYDQFLFLVDQPCLPLSGFGYTLQFEIAEEVKNSQPEEYSKLENKLGKNYYDLRKKQNYENFIKTYFANRNRLCGKSFFPSLLAPPHHLYTSAYQNAYSERSPVRMFKIIFNRVYTKAGKTISISKETVDEITIPASKE
jgi:hypothetical protein